MEVTPELVEREYAWVRQRDDRIVELINEVRSDFEAIFGLAVEPVDRADYRQEVDVVFTAGNLAVNVAGLVAILRNLDVTEDHPGFVVDEILGRELAATIAGTQPLRTLGEATFHYADIQVHGDGDDPAGLDDLEAALAAGFQERLPGWEWTERPSPFAVDQA